MDFLRIFLQERLTALGVSVHASAASFLFVLLCLALFAWCVGRICRRWLVPFVRRIVASTETKFDDYILNDRFMKAVCRLVPGCLFYLLLPLSYAGPRQGALFRAYTFVGTAAEICIVVFVLLAVTAFLSNLVDFTAKEGDGRNHYLVGIVQFANIIAYFFGIIVIIALLLGRSPFNLIAGLGAVATVLMLVFRDSILGLVAGIRLTANKMLKPGDWITIEKLGINGVVERVSLTTVKVRNFDQTISTVPPYTLVSDSFRNWDGMVQAGVRRVKRVLYIDVDTVGFCSEAQLSQLLRRRFVTKAEAEAGPQVNLTLFRHYVERTLRQDARVSPDHWILVRQLEHTPNGLPVELWFYFRETEFVAFEHLASDALERFVAVLPEFGLRLFQLPGGRVDR